MATVLLVTEIFGILLDVYDKLGAVPDVKVNRSLVASYAALNIVPALHAVISSALIAVPALALPMLVVARVFQLGAAFAPPEANTCPTVPAAVEAKVPVLLV